MPAQYLRTSNSSEPTLIVGGERRHGVDITMLDNASLARRLLATLNI